MKNKFDVEAYWNNRYKSKRDSGSGSYGRLSRFKAEVINSFIKEHAITELLELGCGDGNQLGYFDIANYTGVDISAEVVDMCKKKYANEEEGKGTSQKTFLTYTELYNLHKTFECVISLDVIYHLSDDNIYYAYLKDLFTHAKQYVIIYANSTDYHCHGVDPNAGYVLFRDFHKDVENLYKEFTLIDIIPNEFPFSSLIPNDTSFADFYIFERNSTRKIDKDTLFRNFYLKKQLNRQNVATEEIALHLGNQEKLRSLEQKLRDEQSELIQVQNALEYAKQERNSYISKFRYEQKVLVQKNKELSSIKNSRSYKIMRVGWRIKSRLRTLRNKIAKKLYFTFKDNKKIMALLKKINKKLKIIKDPNVITGRKKRVMKQIQKFPVIKKSIQDIKVAVILDEFSYMSFKDDFCCIVLTPDNWKEVMKKEKPDLFFCESAWSGTDSNLRPWKGKIYASVNWKHENRTHLLEILAHCKSHNIPTVFWNKEDPAHYTDRAHDFVKTAILFDHIFTTAEECVEMYKKDYGHTSVFALPFATNPKMFNPIETVPRSKDVVFAGSWYKQHQKRCKEMEMIFDRILDNGLNLKIYNRYSEDEDPNHIFPEKYKPYVHRAVAFSDMPRVYKESELALNINTVVQSKTMFARRVFELASSNTLILSNDFVGKEMFHNNIVIVNEHIDISLADEYRKNNLEQVLQYHTYAQRFKQILNTIEYEYDDTYKKLHVLFYVENFHDVEQIMNVNFLAEFKHSLLLGEKIPTHTIKNYVETYGQSIHIFSEHYIKNYNQSIDIEEKHFVLLKDLDLYKRLESASLHTCYIPKDTGISLQEVSEKYIIKDVDSSIDCILSADKLSEVILHENYKSKVIGV